MEGIEHAEEEENLGISLLDPLCEDLNECEKLLEQSDTQFVRRAFVRAAFAFNEGYVYWLREHVQQWLVEKGWQAGHLEVSKVCLLTDEIVEPNSVGQVVSRPGRTPFLNDCAFVIRTGAECWDLDPGPFFSDYGWCEMQTALRVRHRITHPKHPEELVVAAGEVESVRRAHRWLFSCLEEILSKAETVSRVE